MWFPDSSGNLVWSKGDGPYDVHLGFHFPYQCRFYRDQGVDVQRHQFAFKTAFIETTIGDVGHFDDVEHRTLILQYDHACVLRHVVDGANLFETLINRGGQHHVMYPSRRSENNVAVGTVVTYDIRLISAHREHLRGH